MRYEWDAAKQAINVRKHGIRFADAIPVLEDPNGITISDNESDENEQRFVTMGVGVDALGRILAVVYTYRHENIRLISARQAEPNERRQYEA